MKQATLFSIFNNNNQILLCMKKRWFGVWKYNGPGWKVEEWETIKEAALRELREETWISLNDSDAELKWLFHFTFENKPEWDQQVSLFVTRWFVWDAEETEEMKPEWFDIDKIPYDKMWEDDWYWIPRIIKWEDVEYRFSFDENWKMINYELIR